MAVDEAGDDAFLESLKQAVAASPSRSLLVVVFGYRESLETSALKTAVFSYRIDINTPVMLFDWPGNQPVTIGGYRRAFDYARRSGADLGDLLALIVRAVRPDNLWVTGNSMGAQVVCDAFSDMATEHDLSDAAPEIRHVLLAAPDVGRREFDSRFLQELNALSERLTVYLSSDDTALLLSHWIHGVSRLGRGQAPEPKQLDELENLMALKAEGADSITVIDFTPVNRASAHMRVAYLEHGERAVPCAQTHPDVLPSLVDQQRLSTDEREDVVGHAETLVDRLFRIRAPAARSPHGQRGCFGPPIRSGTWFRRDVARQRLETGPRRRSGSDVE